MLVKKYKIATKETEAGSMKIPLFNSISLNARQDDGISKLLNDYKDNNINEIVDFEKIKLYPTTDINMTGVTDSLCFKLHFFNNNTNNWDLPTTTINNIGFLDDDVKNIRNRLKKTHLLLSFYDSNNVKTQNLLGYSTIFFDYYKMYEEYIASGYTITGIPCEFLIENPILTKNKKSTEGFEIYLYKQDLLKTEPKTIYMKADFNNSSDGTSTLFCNTTGSTQSGDTISDIIKKIFFEVKCEYNNDNKKFYYNYNGYISIENIYDNIKNTMIIDLYQAKAL